MEFNRELLNQGLAQLYDSSFLQRSEYESPEAQAQSEDVGLWNFAGSAATAMPIETVTDSSSDESADSDGSRDSDLPPPSGGSSDPYDYSDFGIQEQAQQVLENTLGAPSSLGGDGTGEACESLPG